MRETELPTGYKEKKVVKDIIAIILLLLHTIAYYIQLLQKPALPLFFFYGNLASSSSPNAYIMSVYILIFLGGRDAS